MPSSKTNINLDCCPDIVNHVPVFIANLAVTGTTIYFAYKNRNKPRWDRRVVSATVIGLAAWFGVQGYAELIALRWVAYQLADLCASVPSHVPSIACSTLGNLSLIPDTSYLNLMQSSRGVARRQRPVYRSRGAKEEDGGAAQ